MNTYNMNDTSTPYNNIIHHDHNNEHDVVGWNIDLKALKAISSSSKLIYNKHKLYSSLETFSGKINMKLDRNIQKLLKFMNYEENWNGYNAPKFNPLLINKAYNIVNKLSIQPEVFPIAGGAIQLEYHKENGEYFEVEVSLDDELSIFTINKNGEESEYNASLDVWALNKKINDFYGR